MADNTVQDAAPKKRGPILMILAALLISALSCGATYMLLRPQQPPAPPEIQSKTTIDLTVLKESMKRNNELSTAKYLYTDAVKVTDWNTLGAFGMPNIVMPGSGSIYILEFDGTIKAGYNLDDAAVNLEGEDTVVITLPQPSVLSHETGSVRAVHEQQSLLNPQHSGQESGWVESQKSQMEQRAIDSGLFDEAQQNAKVTFESLFDKAIPEGATVDVRFENKTGDTNED